MTNWMSRLVYAVVLVFGLVTAGYAQLDTGTITGTVSDESKAVVGNATVTVRNVRTGLTRTTQTDGDGRFRFSSLPIGSYELTVEATGQSKYVQQGIELLVNQVAVLEIGLKVAATQEVVTVTGDASILNTTNAEVSTRFDSQRLMNLPFATNGNVYNILLSVPGVSQLASGQTGFANGISFSSNGGASAPTTSWWTDRTSTTPAWPACSSRSTTLISFRKCVSSRASLRRSSDATAVRWSTWSPRVARTSFTVRCSGSTTTTRSMHGATSTSGPGGRKPPSASKTASVAHWADPSGATKPSFSGRFSGGPTGRWVRASR